MDRAVDVLSRRVVGLHANPCNGSDQYSYTAKHNPLVFFTAANAGNDPTPSNPEAAHYAPMQQLASSPVVMNAIVGEAEGLGRYACRCIDSA
jgi:hypothetical protein